MIHNLDIALAIAGLAAGLVEAVRRRVTLDGWKVLVAVAAACVLVTEVWMRPVTWTMALDALTVAIYAWVIAVGGDSLASKYLRKARVVTLVTGAEKVDTDG